MKPFIHILSAALTVFVSNWACAQSWPERPIKMIVATPPGTGPDIVARLVGEKLASRWGQQIIVDNRPGAGGIPAMSTFTRSAPDGYTLGLLHTGVVALTPHLFKDPKFNMDTDTVTVSTLVSSPLAIAANPRLGAGNLADLIRLSKTQPGKLVFASPILNSVPHLVGDMLSRAAGLTWLTVPYSGSAASITATIAGDGGDITIDAPAPLMQHFKSGRLKPIAVTSQKRLPGLEDVATLAETLPGFEVSGWFAVFAPAKTPPAIVERVNRELQAVMQLPDVVSRLGELGLYPDVRGPQESAAYVLAERDRWAKVTRAMGVVSE